MASLTAPVAIGRDHHDTGSVASPFRETEAMRDGSDAIADWPILNALLNVASGATWVSVHHGGGVGIGNSIHAGLVVVADGSADADRRIGRVLHNDPGIGVARHADAGYPGVRGDRGRRPAFASPGLGARQAKRHSAPPSASAMTSSVTDRRPTALPEMSFVPASKLRAEGERHHRDLSFVPAVGERLRPRGPSERRPTHRSLRGRKLPTGRRSKRGRSA